MKEQIAYVLAISALALFGSVALTFILKGPLGLEQDLFATIVIPLLLAPPIALDAVLKRQKISQLNIDLQVALDHDSLTSAKSRKYLFERYESVALRDEAFPMAVMVVDADRFKHINDTYGHGVGDMALKYLSEALQAECRDGDVVCRIGGEEFALVFPETTADASVPIASRILARLNANSLLTAQGPIAVRASIGITMLQRGEELSAALARADLALYAAKENGRNCAMLAGHDGQVVRVARGGLQVVPRAA